MSMRKNAKMLWRVRLIVYQVSGLKIEQRSSIVEP